MVALHDLGVTERQLEVLGLMMQGKSNKVISHMLNMAEPTVKNHVTAILKALKVTNRTEAVIAVGELGWELHHDLADGPVGVPDAPVVVLGHGAGGNHAIWYQQVPVFARDYYVITWDQRGFGLSRNRDGLANPRTATADLLAIRLTARVAIV